jgi:hypothetical protein
MSTSTTTVLAETGHILAKAAPSGGAIGTSAFAALVVIAIIWYCKKHKGWDMPQVLMGAAAVIVIGATPWGRSLVNGAGDGLTGLFSGLASFLS